MHTLNNQGDPFSPQAKWRPGMFIYDSGFAEPLEHLARDGYTNAALAAAYTHNIICKLLAKKSH